MYTDDINPQAYYGFALSLDKNDSRLEKYQKQRFKDGFDDTETWNLNQTIAKFIVPRLRRFIELDKIESSPHFSITNCKILLSAFEKIAEDHFDSSSEETEAYEIVKILFPKLYPGMWW